MKFDKFMEHCFRILCLVTALVVSVGLISSCGQIKACAEDTPVGIARDIISYVTTYQHNMEALGQAIAEDYKNGNLDYTSEYGKKVLEAYGSQVLFGTDMQRFYEGLANALTTEEIEIEFQKIPSSLNYGGTVGTGIYILDGEYKPVTVMPLPSDGTVFSSGASYTIAYSEDFKVVLNFLDYQDDPKTFTIRYTNNICYCEVSPGVSYVNYEDISGNNVFGSKDDFFGRTQLAWTRNMQNKPIPTFRINGNYSLGNYVKISANSGYSGTFGGSGITVTSPDETIPKETPWNYYNNAVLPNIDNSVDDKYIIDPNGYTPAPSPDPTEPASYPNGGITINNKNTNFNIGINIIYPTDSNGQPITDTNGETVTETAYITDTSPVDGEYNFQMPTLPSLNVPQETIPPPRLSDFSDGLNFIWNSTSNILEESGFLPAVVCVLSLCVLGYILWRIGG